MTNVSARAPQSTDLTFWPQEEPPRLLGAQAFREETIYLCFCYFVISSSFPDSLLCTKKTMAPGESLHAAFLSVLFEQLESPEVLSFARRDGLEEKLDKWRKTLSRIKAVLDDAEEKQHIARTVKKWLDDLTDLTYDMDDILDEFATKALLRKLKGGDQAGSSKVSNLIPACCTHLTPSARKIGFRLGSKIEEITTRFNDMVTQKDELNLEETADGRSNRRRGTLPSTSLVNEALVYEREKDKKAILELLLGEKWSDAQLCVLPILGMGGIGKTTFAQLLYNDEKVQSFFDLQAWACVSEDFNAVRITKTILQSLTPKSYDDNDLDWLQLKLKEKLNGKKFLIILDDVWNENYHELRILLAPFEAGAPGSTLVITTCNEAVARKMGTIPAYHLQLLSADACLSLFTQYALGASDFRAHPNLQDFGKKIVQMCGGLPLAAKTIGGLLRITHPNEWEDVLKYKIWDIPVDRSRIIPALMLSYLHLPSHLKRCFVYCSVLPKGYEFEEEWLILLWMAEGLIHPQEGGMQMEDLGSKYFRDLLGRSFFQQASGDGSRFVMHDLINDLAQSVARYTCFRMGDGFGQRISKKARHFSYLGGEYDGQMFEEFSELTCLRTFLHLMLPEQGGYHFNCYFPLQILPKLRCVRVISLSGYHITDLLESIGDLRHLRYLDLSNTSIKSMPKSTTTLYNLQTLIMENCSKLEKLPSEFWKLVNLRHLNIRKTCSLEGMPPQMGKLTCLQTLSDLVVGKGPRSGVKELGPLSHLRGTLHISKLENVIQPGDARGANLIQKVNLGGLLLEWSCNLDDPQERTNDLEVLNKLQPHKDLKDLTIKCYGGTEFPTWLRTPSFPNMVRLRLENCKKCTSLPPVGQLSSLKYLSITGMAGVQEVGPEFYDGDVSPPFGSLETLHFENMEKWDNWIPCGEFPHLRELSIQSCPKLSGKLPDYLLSIAKINECPLLQDRPMTRVVQDSPKKASKTPMTRVVQGSSKSISIEEDEFSSPSPGPSPSSLQTSHVPVFGSLDPRDPERAQGGKGKNIFTRFREEERAQQQKQAGAGQGLVMAPFSEYPFPKLSWEGFIHPR